MDRTPFHTVYIRERIQPFIDDVLLLKQFAKAGGIYGSDQMTEGFAGYLCELLVLSYGGFLPLLEAASRWRPGIIIDPAGHRARDFPEPLVVVDPVDPKRNVSASVSLTRMCEFIELSRGYIEKPGREFFFPPPRPVLTVDGEHGAGRGSGLDGRALGGVGLGGLFDGVSDLRHVRFLVGNG